MLIIDNYDSFTYNIVQYVNMCGIDTIVIKNDKYSIDDIKNLNFKSIILSPGWGNPDNSGVCLDVIDYYKDKCPIFGICLGMQCIAKYFGGNIIEAPEPYHGKNSEIYFDKDFKLFRGFRQGFSATRYHSLMVEKETPDYQITARTRDNMPMALKVNNRDIYGVQFHPEAILTENGLDIFKNFIKIVNDAQK